MDEHRALDRVTRWLLIAAGCVAAGAVAVAVASAQSSSRVSWSKAVAIDGRAFITAVACSSARQCTAIDAVGNAVTFDPATMHAGPRRSLHIGGTYPGEYRFACSAAGQCVLINTNGHETTLLAAPVRVIASARVATPHQCGEPTCGGTIVHPAVTAVACPGPHLCVTTATWGSSAVFDPVDPGGTALWWTYAIPDQYSVDLIALSCPRAHQCTALLTWDQAVTFDPATPTHATLISLGQASYSGSYLDTLACSTSQCTALGSQNGVAVTFDPHSQAPPATTRTIPTTAQITSVACPAAGLCVAVDGLGRALVADPRTDSTWTATPIPGIRTVTDMACPTATRCVAVDRRGHAAVATIHTP